MKNYKFLPAIAALFLFVNVQGQTKKIISKKATSTSSSVKVVTRNYGSPTSVSQITDVTDSSAYYSSIKNLIENYGVIITYADNTFKGNELLKRGDFVVALNSAFVNLKSKMDAAGLDTSLINTYDRNRGGAYLTSIGQVKDLNENSVYYPAAKSLIERWGVAAPFTINKTLSANSTMPEKEVYDILKATLGYNSAGINPYSTGITRNKFAIVLNNAISQKMTEINKLATIQQGIRDAERRRQLDSLQKLDIIRKDSIAKEIQLRKIEAERQEEEAKKKLKEKQKR
jgi:hypothetical protein